MTLGILGNYLITCNTLAIHVQLRNSCTCVFKNCQFNIIHEYIIIQLIKNKSKIHIHVYVYLCKIIWIVSF